MNKYFLSMLLSVFYFNAFAQTITKKTDFSYTNHYTSQYTASGLSMGEFGKGNHQVVEDSAHFFQFRKISPRYESKFIGIDKDAQGNLVTYAWLQVDSKSNKTVVEVDNPNSIPNVVSSKINSKLGGLGKMMDKIDKMAGVQTNVKKVELGAGIVMKKTLNLSTGKVIGGEKKVVFEEISGDPSKLIITDELANTQKLERISLDKMFEIYPSLNIKTTSHELGPNRINSSLTSNLKLHTISTKLSDLGFYKDTTITASNGNEKFWQSFTPATGFWNLPNSNYIGVVGKLTDEKYSTMKHFSIVTLDKNDKILENVPVDFTYVRGAYMTKVINNTGEMAGTLVVFSADASFFVVSKKERDEVDNRYKIVYINTEGKKVLESTFQVGNPEKKRQFNPILSVYQNNQLHILTANEDKDNSIAEKFIFNADGKIEKQKVDLKDQAGDIICGGSIVSTIKRGNKYFVVSKFTRRGKEGGICTATFDENFNLLNKKLVVLEVDNRSLDEIVAAKDFYDFSYLRANVEDIGGTPMLVIGSKAGEFIKNLETGDVFTVPYQEDEFLNHDSLTKNYVLNQEKNKIYFVRNVFHFIGNKKDKTAKGLGRIIEVSF